MSGISAAAACLPIAVLPPESVRRQRRDLSGHELLFFLLSTRSPRHGPVLDVHQCLPTRQPGAGAPATPLAATEGCRLNATALPILVGLLALAAVTSPAAAQVSGRRSPDLAEVTRLIIDGMNDFRHGEGRGPTAPDAKLSAAARDFASFMARIGRYGHEADGKTPAQRAQDHGYAYCVILENIASLYSSDGFGTEELAGRVMQGWKQSQEHRKSMLDAEVTDIGVAIAQSEKSRTYYAVQLVGRPLSKRIEFRVSNASPVTVDYDLNGKGTRCLRTRRAHTRNAVPRV